MQTRNMKFKHSEATLDPRDKNLVSYNSESKRFVTEASTLRAADIEPVKNDYVLGGHKYTLFLWSEKYGLHIRYRFDRKVYDRNGEVVADVFTPYFGIISTRAESLASTAAAGTELHILND